MLDKLLFIACLVVAACLMPGFNLTWDGTAAHLGISQARADVTYIYDELGRLTGVVDGAGNAADYSYDAAGNVISITRQNAGQVSIIEFTPNSGPVGTSVTLYGTGFSTTASQNTVRFNGVAAAVTAATATSLSTSVPAGATTGPISVTTPSGSANSSGPFTVTASNGAPTITGFAPGIGPVGTPITITGTNFDTTAVKDKLLFNVSYAQIGSVTATSIATSVPYGATSGHVSVTTPAGKAVSSADFFVPPAPYAAADVAVTGRIAIDDTGTVTIGTAGKIGLILFDGAAGQRVTVTMSGVTMSGNVSIIRPDGGTLISSMAMWNGNLIDPPVTLPSSGTYTILVVPSGGSTGSLTLNLFSVPPDVTGTIAMDGAPVTVTTTVAGQNASLTFSVAAGQQFALQATSSTYPDGTNVVIYYPDANGLASTNNGYIYNSAPWGFVAGSWTDTLNRQPPQVAGIYTIVVNQSGTGTGSLTLKLFSVPPDVTGTIAMDGAPVTVTTTVAGQNASLTFSVAAGQQFALQATSSTYPDGTNVVIYYPDANGLASTNNGYIYNSAPWGFVAGSWTDTLNRQPPQVAGIYTIVVNQSGTGTGSLTLKLFSVPPDVTGTIMIDGAPVTVTTTVAGQNASLTFSASAGQRVALQATSCTYPDGTNVVIYYPDANGLASTNNGYIYNSAPWGFVAGSSTGALTLDPSGTYTIVVNQSGTGTGGITFSLTSQ